VGVTVDFKSKQSKTIDNWLDMRWKRNVTFRRFGA